MPSTEIDVPELLKISDAVGRVAARMDGFSTGMEGWARTGSDAVDGSYFCAELGSFTRWWAQEIGELAGAVRGYGGDLRQTAEDYRSYDEMTAQQLRQVEDPTFGEGRYR